MRLPISDRPAEHRAGAQKKIMIMSVFKEIGFWVFVAIVAVLAVSSFLQPSSAQAQSLMDRCQLASKHCWCRNRVDADEIRSQPDRFRRVEDMIGNKNDPVICIEYVGQEQSAAEGRTCVARRVCGGTS